MEYNLVIDLPAMIYVLSIDWLSLFCIHLGQGEWLPKNGGTFTYKTENFGTRSFSRFVRVRLANDEGGTDEFAEIQATPYSSILPEYAIIIRFVNRALYLPDFWDLADRLLTENNFSFNSISRIDICADFNNFATLAPKELIERFAAKKLRHIGRGVGALYFNHGIGAEKDLTGAGSREYGVNYTGISFGTHSSDARVYLYNKTFELLTQGDKPWIRDTWRAAGLDIRHVWRLEVSIKRSGLHFKDKTSGSKKTIDVQSVYDRSELDKVYHTFVNKLFAFVKNPPSQKNISREPRVTLFDGRPAYDRCTIQNLSPGNRTEKILIKSLHQLADRYRGRWIDGQRETAENLASILAITTDLSEWYQLNKTEWETPIHK